MDGQGLRKFAMGVVSLALLGGLEAAQRLTPIGAGAIVAVATGFFGLNVLQKKITNGGAP